MVGAWPGVDYDEGKETLEPGDRILAYTDGVTETPHQDQGVDQLYGKSRLKDLFMKHIAGAPEDILRSIIEDLKAFGGQSTFHDDVCLLIVAIE